MRTSTLHQAAREGNLPVIRRLLAKGADVNQRDPETGHTPLMAACLSEAAGPEIVRLLIDHGADVHARLHTDAPAVPDVEAALGELDLAEADMDPGLLALIEQSRQLLKSAPSTPPHDPPLIAFAVKGASLEKIRLLIESGVDVSYRSASGYTLLIDAACCGRFEVMDLLIDAGAPLDGVSAYNESALGVLSHRGHFAQVRKLLDRGADPTPLGWTPLMQATALGTVAEMRSLLDAGADCEASDPWKRTAFLLAIHAGEREKVALLLAHGADPKAAGHCGKPPLSYAVDHDDTEMLRLLLGQGCDPNQTDEFDSTPLMAAAEHSAVGCFRLLTEVGADWSLTDHVGEDIVPKSSHPEIIAMLIERGLDLAKLETSVLRDFIGLGTVEDLPVTKKEYRRGRFHRFGTTNPERMAVPFWQAMVRCGWSAYQGADHFGDATFDHRRPVWCHDRIGMSLTLLPDGRFIQIAGEHEDGYDPDFCIYNDVIIHDGKGGFEILGYPEADFPPTDFHTATLVSPWIYVIGNLGWPATREAHAHQTPVYRLHTETWVMERVETLGESPGWIHSHHATLENGRIRVAGGKIATIDAEGKAVITDHHGTGALDLETMTWLA
jgi:ankyrin repeat protein